MLIRVGRGGHPSFSIRNLDFRGETGKEWYVSIQKKKQCKSTTYNYAQVGDLG